MPTPAVAAPAVTPQVDPNDWWTARVLSPVYTAAVDAVVSDKQVVERLGEQVTTDIQADALYRRTNTGALNTESETIEFDIIGANGAAVVTVVTSGAGGPKVHIDTITVELDDGTILDVTPPPDQRLEVR